MPVFNNILAGAAAGGAGDFKIERSVRLSKEDGAHFSKTYGSAGNQTKWTWSSWIKRTAMTNNGQSIFSVYTGANSDAGYFNLHFNGSNQLDMGGWHTNYFRTSRVFRDPAAWMHICVAYDRSLTDSNRIKVFVNGVRETSFDSYNASATATYPLNSANLHNVGANAYYTNNDGKLGAGLAEVHFLDGVVPGTATDNADGAVTGIANAEYLSDFGEFNADTGAWNPKKYSGSHGANGFHLDFSDNSSNAALGTDSSGNSNTWTANNFQAASSGTGNYLANLTSNGTNTYAQDNNNFLKSFDGNLNTEWLLARSSTVVDGTLNFPGGYTMQDANNGLRIYTGASWYISSFLYRKWYSVNGGSYTMMGSTSDTNGVGAPKRWVTIPVPGGTLNSLSVRTHSDNGSWGSGFASAVELDGVILTDNMISSGCDSLVDSPTNYEADSGNNGGNYCTWNPFDKNTNATLSNGNLKAVCGTTEGVNGTIALPSSGKYYFEIEFNAYNAAADTFAGLMYLDQSNGTRDVTAGGTRLIIRATGNILNNSSSTSAGSSFAANDILGVACDCSANSIQFYKNGSSIGSAQTLSPAPDGTNWAPYCSSSNGACTFVLNTGQLAFAHTPPTGYKSLCTTNFDDPLIKEPSTAFDVVTYTGDNNASRTITTGFGPDLVWLKSRNNVGGDYSHRLFDTVRGIDLGLCTNSTGTEENRYTAACGGVHAFSSTGFTLSQSGGNVPCHNATNNSMVTWAWDGGDLATNSAYNQDRTWSDGVTVGQGNFLVPATSAFDGNSATSAAPYDTSGGGGANPSITVTFSPGLPYTSSVKVERQNGNASNVTVSMNGGTAINSAFQAYTTLATGSGTLNSITVTNTGSSNTCGISRIEVDGKVLVDKGVIPVGSLNSSAYDQRTTWTNGLTADDRSFNSSYPATQFFDGNKTTFASTGGSGGGNSSGTVDLGNYFPSSNGPYRVEVGCTSANATVTISGVQHDTADASNPAIRIWTSVASVPSIVMDDQGAFGGSHIIINGKLLVDSGVSVANVPSIASTCRTNQTAGMSIVSYTGVGASGGTSVAHNLNAEPDFMILKKRSGGAASWIVWWRAFGSSGNSDYFFFESQGKGDGGYNLWDNIVPTSSAFTISNNGHVNAQNDPYIGYIFSAVNGYSKFGKYQSSGDTFVHTGFRPKMVIFKSQVTAHWIIMDTDRDINNGMENHLHPNLNNGEATAADRVDFLSNGFKLISNYGETNDGQVYYYAAFAESPFKYSRAR